MKDKKKKPFFKTTVGSVLKGVGSVIAPGLVNALEKAGNVGEALNIIKDSNEPPEVKFKLQELALEQYQAEVADRVAARNREAAVASSGGSDILFKTVGWGITAAFILVVLAALGLIELGTDNTRLFDMAFGAVVAKMTQIVSYYFGSSMGSKRKTELMQ